MTDDTKRCKSKLAKLFRRRRKNKCEKKTGEEKQSKRRIKIFGKGGHITRLFRRLNLKRKETDEEKNLVVEEEIEIFSDPIQSVIEERKAKKAARKEKRKKRMKKVKRAAFRTCHYIGMGASNMAPALVYHSPNIMAESFNYRDPSYYKPRTEMHWSAGIVLANW